MPTKRTVKKRNGAAATAAAPPPRPEHAIGAEINLTPSDTATLARAADPLAEAHSRFGRFMDQYYAAMDAIDAERARLDAQRKSMRAEVQKARADYEATIRATAAKYEGIDVTPESKQAWAYNGSGTLWRTA